MGYEHYTLKQCLTAGSHFGEIGLLYRCPRSATVQTAYYATCASLTKQKYQELTRLHPNLKALFVKEIDKYSDPFKVFLELKLSRLKWFRELPKHVKNEFIFNMQV